MDKRIFKIPFSAHRGTFIPLLTALLIMIVLMPVLASVPLASTIIVSMALIAGIAAVQQGLEIRVGMAVLWVIVVGLRWIAYFLGERYPTLVVVGDAAISLYLFLLALSCVIVVLARGRVTHDTIVGAICGYLLIAFVFAFWYSALQGAFPGSFVTTSVSREYEGVRVGAATPDFLYHSVVVLTTVGFGDIVPVTPAARSSAMLEMLVGQIYLAAFVARIVGIMGTDNPIGGAQTRRE